MPRMQKSYDYPDVHPPHPQTGYRTPPHHTDTQTDNRYSWAEAEAEEQNRQPVYNSRMIKTQSTAPPLPVVPDHLNQEHQIQRAQEQTLHQAVRQQHSHQPQQPYHHQDQAKSTEAAMRHQSNQPPQPNFQGHIQYQQEEPKPQPSTQPDQAPQRPDPVKQTPDHPNYRTPIMPDENPLTPTSPLDRKTTPRPQTTNMPLGVPARSTYNFSNYAPVPQVTTGGSWNHSLCSCSEPTICLTGLFCPCILYGRTQYRLHMRSDKKDPTNMLGYNAVNGSCMTWAFLCGINGILSGIQKTRVRRNYEMETGSGNVFSDCLAGCCCCCCVLAQNEKEVKFREESARRTHGQDGYVPPMSMMFAQPPR